MNENLRILIVDDDQRMAKTLKDIFTVKGYEAEVAHSGHEALEKVAESHFNCILTDIKMPEMNGVAFYKMIKKEKPDIPVVLMTAYSDDKLVKEGLEEGVIAALTKPLDIEALLSFFSMLRKDRSVVIVDDDSNFCKTLGGVLQVRGFQVEMITDPHDVVSIIRADVQVLLLDMKLNGMSGLDILKEIRKHYPDLPVILVTGYRDEMGKAIEAALKIGAYTCLYKPLQIEELLQFLNEIHQRGLAKALGHPISGK